MSVNPYLKVQVETSSPIEQVIMLYDRAILLLKNARRAIKENDLVEKIESINKADRIIRLLNSSLDFERGGEIAKNLRELYNFVLDSLILVNSKNDVERLDGVIEILETLKEGWEGIKNKVE
jgi:flagellar protein FliS